MILDQFDLDYDFLGAAGLFRETAKQNGDAVHAAFLHAAELASRHQFHQAARSFAELGSNYEGTGFIAAFHAGMCHLLDGRLVQAAGAFHQAESFDSDDYLLHLYSGMVYHLLGIFGRANTHWSAARRIEETPIILDITNRFIRNWCHPERLALYPVCNGIGIDVGCGSRKTHPNAIGIDLVPRNELGRDGCVAGQPSEADLTLSGDDLHLIEDNTLDYVVNRHNLEHYQDPILALQEWYRVLKPGGILGMVLPDDRNCDTIALDRTHKHVFIPSSIRRILGLMGGLNVIYIGDLQYHWSFLCIAQKHSQALGPPFDYLACMRSFERDQVRGKARQYRSQAQYALAEQCDAYLADGEFH